MGSNYYLKLKDSQRKINQPDLHIGKKSSGWDFVFRGHENDDDLNIPSLKSKKEWFEYLFLNSDNIFNEYNKNIPFLDFVKVVQNSKNPNNLNHYIEMKKNGDNCSDTFNDLENFTIVMSDFS